MFKGDVILGVDTSLRINPNKHTCIVIEVIFPCHKIRDILGQICLSIIFFVKVNYFKFVISPNPNPTGQGIHFAQPLKEAAKKFLL